MSDGPEPSKGHMGPPPHHQPLGPAPLPPSRTGAATPSDATMLCDSAIPVSAVSGGTNALSYTREPSTVADAKGRDVFQTGAGYAMTRGNCGSAKAYAQAHNVWFTI
jgi:hypothetical protein